MTTRSTLLNSCISLLLVLLLIPFPCIELAQCILTVSPLASTEYPASSLKACDELEKYCRINTNFSAFMELKYFTNGSSGFFTDSILPFMAARSKNGCMKLFFKHQPTAEEPCYSVKYALFFFDQLWIFHSCVVSSEISVNPLCKSVHNGEEKATFDALQRYFSRTVDTVSSVRRLNFSENSFMQPFLLRAATDIKPLIARSAQLTARKYQNTAFTSKPELFLLKNTGEPEVAERRIKMPKYRNFRMPYIPKIMLPENLNIVLEDENENEVYKVNSRTEYFVVDTATDEDSNAGEEDVQIESDKIPYKGRHGTVRKMTPRKLSKPTDSPHELPTLSPEEEDALSDIEAEQDEEEIPPTSLSQVEPPARRGPPMKQTTPPTNQATTLKCKQGKQAKSPEVLPDKKSRAREGQRSLSVETVKPSLRSANRKTKRRKWPLKRSRSRADPETPIKQNSALKSSPSIELLAVAGMISFLRANT